jgi:hypothetical protein
MDSSGGHFRGDTPDHPEDAGRLPGTGGWRVARLTPWAAPRPPGFIALGSGEEIKNGKGEAFRFPLFTGRPAGARVAPQRCPILRRDIFRVREVIKKLNRTIHVL